MSKSKRQKRLAIKPPRRHRMTRHGRLESARATNWVAMFQGKHIARAYRRWFNVDPLCAIEELKILGVKFSHAYEAQVQCTMEERRQIEEAEPRWSDQQELDKLNAILAEEAHLAQE